MVNTKSAGKTSIILVPAGNRLRRCYSDSFLNEARFYEVQKICFSREDMISANVIPAEFKKFNLPLDPTESAKGRINEPSFTNKLKEEKFLTSAREINREFLAFPRETSIQHSASDMSLNEMSNDEIQPRLKPLPDDYMILGDFQCSSRITSDSWLNELRKGCTVKFHEAEEEEHGRGNQGNSILLRSTDSEHQKYINMVRGEGLQYAGPISNERPAPMAPDIVNADFHKNSECQEGNDGEIVITRKVASDSNCTWLINFSEVNDKFYPKVFSSSLSTDILNTKGDIEHEEKNKKQKGEIDQKANMVQEKKYQDVAIQADIQEEYGKVIDKSEEDCVLHNASYVDQQQHLNSNASTYREDEQFRRTIGTAFDIQAVARQQQRKSRFGLVTCPFLLVVIPLVLGTYFFLKFFLH